MSEFQIPLLFQLRAYPPLQCQNLLHDHAVQQIVQQQLLRVAHEYFRISVLNVVGGIDDGNVAAHELLDVLLGGHQSVGQQNPILVDKGLAWRGEEKGELW